MSTPAPDYKKAAADVVYYSVVVGLGDISFGLEKTKVVARIELKFELKDGGKLLANLVFSE